MNKDLMNTLDLGIHYNIDMSGTKGKLKFIKKILKSIDDKHEMENVTIDLINSLQKYINELHLKLKDGK